MSVLPPRITGLFISGTGTDVGKTLVATGVLRWMFARGKKAMVMKPVQTGATRDTNGRLSAPDVELVLRATGLTPDEESMACVSPWRFEAACSPHLAARLAGAQIQIEPLLVHAQWLAERYGYLVVEGAGGLMAPLNESETMLDLMVALGMPVLLVGHSGLGAINHMLLSIEALRRRSLAIAGVVLTATVPVPPVEQYIHDDNAEIIARLGGVPVLARIPFLGTPPDLRKFDEILASCTFVPEEQP